MGYITVDKLKPGMTLDEDVRDVNTRLLLSKGQKVTEKHLRILRIWGVSGVSIIGGSDEKATELPRLDDAGLERIKLTMQRVFKYADINQATLKGVYKAALMHRLKVTGGDAQPAVAEPPVDDAARDPLQPIHDLTERLDDKLPETPTIIAELNQVINNSFATSNDVAQVVNKSPSLAATLLKIVNSAYYGFPSKIDRVTRAVTIIGTKEISSLALGISVMRAFEDIPKDVVDMPAFLRHSLACGIIARILAAFSNIAQTEQLFIAGLLHDIGKLIVYKYYPEHASACFRKALSDGTSVYQAEKQLIGMHHPKIAQLLLKKWKLPTGLNDTVVHHHMPNKAANPKHAAIVHLADIIVHGTGTGKSGERSIPRFDYAMLEAVMQAKPDLPTIVRQAVHQLGPLEAIFQGVP